MKAVVNIPSNYKTPKGKYVCINCIRNEWLNYPSYSLQELIDMVIKDDSGVNMDENELAEFFKSKITNNS